MPKVAQIKAQCQKKSLHVFLEADGGINEETIGVAAKSGVDICVSGTGIFKASNAKAAIDRLKRLASQGGCMASAIAHGRPNV